MSTKSLTDRVTNILEHYNRPQISAEEVLLILREEGLNPGELLDKMLENEVRWVVLFRIERKTDSIPPWRELEEEDDFFE